MTDLRETSDQRAASEIDKIGWMFAVAVVVITVVAGMIAYQGWDAVAPTPHIVASR